MGRKDKAKISPCMSMFEASLRHLLIKHLKFGLLDVHAISEPISEYSEARKGEINAKTKQDNHGYKIILSIS